MPAVRSASGLTSNSAANAAVPVPAGAAINDVVVVCLYKENTAAVTPPAGFTLKDTATVSGSHEQRIFWKRLTAADTGTYNFTWTGGTWREATAVAVSGCATTGDPFDVTATGFTASAVTSTPSVSGTTIADGDVLLWSGTNFTGGAWTQPSGWTLQQSSSESLALASLGQTTHGSTGSVSGSCANAGASTAWLGALQGVAATSVTSSDTGTLTDSGQLNLTATDSAAFGEVPNVGSTTPGVSDGITAVEVSQVDTYQPSNIVATETTALNIAVTDTFTVAEQATSPGATGTTVSAGDSATITSTTQTDDYEQAGFATLSETGTVNAGQTGVSAADTLGLSDISTDLSINTVNADATLTDIPSILSRPTQPEALTFGEQVVVSFGPVATDSAAMVENAQITTSGGVNPTAADLILLTEIASLSGTFIASALDTANMREVWVVVEAGSAHDGGAQVAINSSRFGKVSISTGADQ